MTTTGRCLCKATTYAFEGEMAWAGHCHCESCRRNCSAPFVTFFGAPRVGFRWTGQLTGKYLSSAGVHRNFCTTCGTPMAYDGDFDRVNIHLYAASLDDYSTFQPEFHVFHNEKVSWVTLGDDLVIHPQFGGVT
jgi:hypothetical protein